MKLSKWLTISSNGSAKITASKPYLDANQVSMKLNINLPDALFEKPALVASTGLTFAISVANGAKEANG